MDNIGTIFYEQSSLVGARLTDNDASPDLIDDKTQWKGRVHNQHIINNLVGNCCYLYLWW